MLTSSVNAVQGSSRTEAAGSRKGPPKVKHLITRGRERYIDEEFDLDLTYITERIIAMSFPASGLESTYRNSLKDVAKMLQSKHQNNYMVFNVSERSYDTSKFNNQVLDFGWPDHLAPSLDRLSSVCKSMKSWLDSAPQHVAVVHCKGGKGRTGCVIAAFIHYTELCKTAQEALDHFAMKRFTGNKPGGVTQPSQRRYVFYFGDLLKGKINIQGPPMLLRHIIIHGVPDYDGKGGCRPFVKVYQNLELLVTTGLYVCGGDNQRVKISFYGGTLVQGEVLLKCFHKKQTGGQEVIFRVQFHTSAVQDYQLVLAKRDLDEAYKDKRFPESAKVEVIFSQYVETDKGSRGEGGVW
jgi:tensin